jgi:hypothetical protein
MYPALLEDALNLFRGDQRARRIMDSDIFRVGTKAIQTGAHGILTMFATRNNRVDFFEIFIADDLFDFTMSIFASHNDDFINGSGALERQNRMRDRRFPGNCHKQFVKTRAPAATGGDDDGG